MGDPYNNPFIFNSEFDVQSLRELYGGDYAYIQEVFTTVLDEYEALSSNVLSAHQDGNMFALKTAVHKIKPVFGFVGLSDVQQQCQQFEGMCMTVTSTATLEEAFAALEQNLIRCRRLIEDERKRLDSFNHQRA